MMSTEHLLFLLLQRLIYCWNFYGDSHSVVHVSEYCFAVDYNLSSLCCNNHSNNIFSFCTVSIVLRSAATLLAGQKYSALAEALDGREVPNIVNSLPLVKGYKLMKSPLFACSHFSSFPKGRFIVCMLNCQAQSFFLGAVLFLHNSESQTGSSAGMHAVQTLLHRRLYPLFSLWREKIPYSPCRWKSMWDINIQDYTLYLFYHASAWLLLYGTQIPHLSFNMILTYSSGFLSWAVLLMAIEGPGTKQAHECVEGRDLLFAEAPVWMCCTFLEGMISREGAVMLILDKWNFCGWPISELSPNSIEMQISDVSYI